MEILHVLQTWHVDRLFCLPLVPFYGILSYPIPPKYVPSYPRQLSLTSLRLILKNYNPTSSRSSNHTLPYPDLSCPIPYHNNILSQNLPSHFIPSGISVGPASTEVLRTSAQVGRYRPPRSPSHGGVIKGIRRPGAGVQGGQCGAK